MIIYVHFLNSHITNPYAKNGPKLMNHLLKREQIYAISYFNPFFKQISASDNKYTASSNETSPTTTTLTLGLTFILGHTN